MSTRHASIIDYSFSFLVELKKLLPSPLPPLCPLGNRRWALWHPSAGLVHNKVCAVSRLLSPLSVCLYFLFYLILFYVHEYLACMYVSVQQVCVQCPQRPEELDPLELEQQMAVTAVWVLGLKPRSS